MGKPMIPPSVMLRVMLGVTLLWFGIPLCIAAYFGALPYYPNNVPDAGYAYIELMTAAGAALLGSGLAKFAALEEREEIDLYGLANARDSSRLRLWACASLFLPMLLVAVVAGESTQHYPQDLYQIPYTNWKV